MSEELKTECRSEVTAHLQGISPLLTAALRAIVVEQHPPTTFLLWFEYDSPDFENTFAVMFCRMNRRGGADEVRELLPQVPFVIPPDIVADPRYEEADLSTWHLASEVFVPWFADCWEAAGGHRSRWPGYIAHHDSSYSFDLSARRELRSPDPQYPEA